MTRYGQVARGGLTNFLELPRTLGILPRLFLLTAKPHFSHCLKAPDDLRRTSQFMRRGVLKPQTPTLDPVQHLLRTDQSPQVLGRDRILSSDVGRLLGRDVGKETTVGWDAAFPQMRDPW